MSRFRCRRAAASCLLVRSLRRARLELIIRSSCPPPQGQVVVCLPLASGPPDGLPRDPSSFCGCAPAEKNSRCGGVPAAHHVSSGCFCVAGKKIKMENRLAHTKIAQLCYIRMNAPNALAYHYNSSGRSFMIPTAKKTDGHRTTKKNST